MMKTKKAWAAGLVLVMLCALLSGCVYNDSNAVIHDNGSGTVSFASGLLADEESGPEEGQEVFEANGNKYYGTTKNYEFASVEEFNKLFTIDGEGSIESNSSLACTLRKNSDGSLTLVASVKQDEKSDSEGADSEIGDAMMETAFVHYAFTFDQPIRQTAGSADAVTISGGKLTIDLVKQPKGDSGVYAFVTDVASRVRPTQQALKVDGVAKETEIYNINDANYFKLRDMAALLNGTAAQFSVDYKDGTIIVKTGEAYTAVGGELTIPAAKDAEAKAAGAVKSSQSLQINGEAAYLAPYNIGDNNYFALRDLGAALGFKVDYDAATSTMLVTTK